MARVNEAAPELEVDTWLQGPPTTLAEQRGKVVLVEVFQVNCPGCFLGGIPEVLEVRQRFQNRPLVTWGLATAFEDFQINTLENLQKLLTTGEVLPHVQAALATSGFLSGNRLAYEISFPVAWDKVVPRKGAVTDEAVRHLIDRDFPDFDNLPGKTRDLITQQVKAYLKQKPYDAWTFDRYGLRGTPSTILIDKQGILRYKWFGSGQGIAEGVTELLNE